MSAGFAEETQVCQHNDALCKASEALCATGVLLQLPAASRSCATCRRFLDSTDLESYPRNYALEAALDERARRVADTTGSELDPSTLRITEEVLGERGNWGGEGWGTKAWSRQHTGQPLCYCSTACPVSDVLLRAGRCQNASYTGG